MTTQSLEVKPAPDGATFRVRVAPRASKCAIAGQRGGALLVRITAAPVDGEANQALRRFLAKALDTAPSRLAVVHGEKSREKTLRVTGLPPAELASRLAALLLGAA